MLDFVKKYGSNIHSQNGEDGIIAECLKRMGMPEGICAEAGAHNGIFCSNTRALIEAGWTGILIEADADLSRELADNTIGMDVVLHPITFLTKDNVDDLIPSCDVLSLDTDGPDYEIWDAIETQPAIVIIEINSSKTSIEHFITPNQGTSYKPMVELGIAKGYFLLCHTGNLVFVRNDYRDLFPEIEGDGLSNWDEYFDTKWLYV